MKRSQIAISASVLAVLAVGFVACMTHTPQARSLSERRALAQRPTASVQTLSSGTYMSNFESYALDQFPMREMFRTVKAEVQYRIFAQKDNNGIYCVGGSLSKIESTLSESSVTAAATKLSGLQQTYFSDSAVYYAIVPDKNYYLAESAGYPHLDYTRMETLLQKNLTSMTEIRLFDTLTAADYYKSDSHWRQECLGKTAQTVAAALGVRAAEPEKMTAHSYDKFHGVYWGQSALALPAETLTYLSDHTIDTCTVHHYETETDSGIYEKDLLTGNDSYDVFLGGADALLTITNPQATTDRELIIFRDSFGSSLAPLLVRDYKSVTLVDLRYMSSSILEEYLDFHGQDVLFLYSPAVYNQSTMLK